MVIQLSLAVLRAFSFTALPCLGFRLSLLQQVTLVLHKWVTPGGEGVVVKLTWSQCRAYLGTSGRWVEKGKIGFVEILSPSYFSARCYSVFLSLHRLASYFVRYYCMWDVQ